VPFRDFFCNSELAIHGPTNGLVRVQDVLNFIELKHLLLVFGFCRERVIVRQSLIEGALGRDVPVTSERHDELCERLDERDVVRLKGRAS
jgi:hypothetical protein